MVFLTPNRSACSRVVTLPSLSIASLTKSTNPALITPGRPDLWSASVEVKKAKIRNQVLHLTWDTIWESDKNTRKHKAQENQEVSPFPSSCWEKCIVRSSLVGSTLFVKKLLKHFCRQQKSRQPLLWLGLCGLMMHFLLLQLCERNWDQVPEKRLTFKESLASLNEIYPIKGRQVDNMVSLVRYLPILW